MKEIKNIIFDFGGVLIDWNQRYFYRDYFKNDEKMEYFLSNVATTEWNSQMDEGRTFEECIKELQAQYPEYHGAIGLYRIGWDTMLHDSIPESVKLLEDCKKQGYGMYGLTNWSAETIGVAYGRYPFFQLFEGIVVSGEEKMLKPNPLIYKTLLERYKLNAEECVFLDDNAANVAAARELGISALVFDNAANVREQLKQLGINLEK